MSTLALDRGRMLNGSRQRRVFRATGGESTWMPEFDALQLVKRLSAEYSLEPFGGQTYSVTNDAYNVEALRGAITAIDERQTARAIG